MPDEWDAREGGAALLADVTRAIRDERARAAGQHRPLRDSDLARAVLRSPALTDSNRKLLDEMLAEVEPEVAAMAAPIAEAAARDERERIRQMAIRNQAVCTGDEGTGCYFADLLGPGADPETPLSDALHTLGQVQRMAESMAETDNPTVQECGRRILAAIGPQGDEEPASPVAAELDGPEIDVPLPFPEEP